MRRLGLALVLLLCACSGCGGGSTKQLEIKQLPGAVLQPSDLASWTRFQDDSGTAADASFLGSRERTGVWIARYRGSTGIVVSRIDLYRDTKAAHDVFASFSSKVVGNGVVAQHVSALGDERVGFAAGTPPTLESVFWRRANAIVSLTLQGAGTTRGEAMRLATLDDARVVKALG